MRLLAPAKINLHLRVAPLTADGFHPLLTWMCTVSLFDTLTLEVVQDSGGSSPPLTLTCDDPTLACDATNLVVRAGAALAQSLEGGAGGPAGATPRGRLPRVRAVLQKRIPAGAGLGGGSSDGARTLEACNRLWRAGWDPGRLAELAARFGSDLPFFFHGPSSVCTGRGQFVRPVAPPARARWAVLVLPALHMPTPAVYRTFDRMGLGRPEDVSSEPPWDAWGALPAAELMGRLVNDLEVSAFAAEPRLAALRGEIEQRLSRPARMSGSGSSLFVLFDSGAEAAAAAERLEPVARAWAGRVDPRPGASEDRETIAALRCVELCPQFHDDLNAPPQGL